MKMDAVNYLKIRRERNLVGVLIYSIIEWIE